MNIKEKNRIFNKLIPSLKENDFNNYNFNKILKKNNIKETDFYYHFPKKTNDLCCFFFNKIALKTEKKLVENLNKEKSISKRVNYLLQNYIILLDKEKKIAIYFLNFLTIKPFLLKKISLEYADKIWVILKDNSTDFNFYTKRLTLSQIFINSLIFWRGSNNQEQTLNFIKKQISALGKFGYFKYHLNSFLKKMPIKNFLSNFDFLHKN